VHVVDADSTGENEGLPAAADLDFCVHADGFLPAAWNGDGACAEVVMLMG
jgi:hypothetical protein